MGIMAQYLLEVFGLVNGHTLTPRYYLLSVYVKQRLLYWWLLTCCVRERLQWILEFAYLWRVNLRKSQISPSEPHKWLIFRNNIAKCKRNFERPKYIVVFHITLCNARLDVYIYACTCTYLGGSLSRLIRTSGGSSRSTHCQRAVSSKITEVKERNRAAE